ncbi:DegT/DnrJ/EryC1/StrS aminotransferase family protein [Halobacteriovorax sp. HLS]|uniref:DegT/DnrJ/EryC1/StrS family aminotransferase n=1 Tax=Halobacteriovorax sp. HLS TaxID=2234000 RepID=UPI0019D4DBC7|nr:DegT/DnrJ/EryC1/StrS aminotransferase family protein [Halobacteriovorax sp. HLS]
MINIPLMQENITRDDLDILVEYLKQDNPRLTAGSEVLAFEKEWSEWLGVKYSLFLNSGSSANILTMAAIKHLYGDGEIIVPSLTWVSDISSVMFAGLTPIFVDINPKNLAMCEKQVLSKITDKTKAVFITHILGFNGLSQDLLDELKKREILLIEDVCESHGATFNNKKLGSYGFASNFSFYFAHHMSTIEGGVVCTNDEKFYQTLRMLRSHGMVRELSSQEMKDSYINKYPDLNPEFIFSYPSYNMRSTELNAIIGRSQLKKLDANNDLRRTNCDLFYSLLDSEKYRTDFDLDGAVNYAFVLILKDKDDDLMKKVSNSLRDNMVEFRRGTSGGGNQLRQPYLREIMPPSYYEQFPETDHIHFYGMYIGNYPGLEVEKIKSLCELLNSL